LKLSQVDQSKPLSNALTVEEAEKILKAKGANHVMEPGRYEQGNSPNKGKNEKVE